MAGEIQLNTILQVMNPATGAGFVSSEAARQQSITQAAQGQHSDIYTVPTTAAGVALSLGNISTLGVSYFQNLDATNYLEIGINSANTFFPVLRLNATESYPFRFAQGITPYARANTATCKLYYKILEN